MKIRTTITSFENLKKLAAIGIKDFVAGSKDFALRTTTSFELNEINEMALYAHENNLTFNVLITKLFRNYELNDLKKYLESLKNVSNIIIADPAVYQIIKKNNLKLNFIIDQETITTNHFTTDFWFKLGASEVTLARELTLEEINKICEFSNKITIQAHGFMYMFHSPRKLITNYANEINENINKIETLYDETRDLSYPIIEDESGTHIMSGFEQCTIDLLNHFKNVETIFLNGYLLEENYFFNVVNNYQKALQNEDVKSLKQDIQENSKNNIDYGFLFKPTVYKVKK